MLGNTIRLFMIFTWIKFTRYQFVVSHKANDNLNTCETSRSSRLVEHFFNMIFTEFHTTPPVCTCVQMCPDQAAYCYPNGCMKKNMKETDTKNSREQYRRSAQTNIRNVADTKPVRLLIEDKDDFLAFFEKTHKVNTYTEKTDRPVENNLRPSLFKDRYNMLIKYKRIPKVELKYNLREQVKTMKSAKLKIESIDMAKTRWPHPNKNIRSPEKTVETEKETFVTPVVMENNPTFMKKGFLKRENTDEEVNEDVHFVTKKPTLEDKTYSCNTSRDSQIEINSSIKNVSKVPIIANVISNTESGSIDHPIPENEISQKKIYVVLRLGEGNAVPVDEKTDKLGNFDIDSSINLKEVKNNTFNEMIASLFKTTERRDNTSIEIEGPQVNTINTNEIKREEFEKERSNRTADIKTTLENKNETNASTQEVLTPP